MNRFILSTGFVLMTLSASVGLPPPEPDRPAAKPPASQHAENNSPPLRAQARQALRRGDLDKARKIMNQARVGILSTAERIAWWLLEADLEYAEQRYAASGLAAMRVVILHPKTPEAGEALFAAARAYEKLDRPAKAVELYEECVQHARVPAAVKSRAADRIKAMKAAP